MLDCHADCSSGPCSGPLSEECILKCTGSQKLNLSDMVCVDACDISTSFEVTQNSISYCRSKKKHSYFSDFKYYFDGDT
jgi:hypothetical protein